MQYGTVDSNLVADIISKFDEWSVSCANLEDGYVIYKNNPLGNALVFCNWDIASDGSDVSTRCELRIDSPYGEVIEQVTLNGLYGERLEEVIENFLFAVRNAGLCN